jgi:hypothetical protein
MMRGGYQALRLIMENAQTPLNDEQEKQIQAIYVDFNRQIDQVNLNNKGTSSRVELDKLENEALGKVVRLLTPMQRRSLAASRQGTITGKIRP